MARPMIRRLSLLLLAGISIGAAGQVHAGQTVTINFSGSGEGTTLGPANFSGTFSYDEAQSGTSSGSGNTYTFTLPTVVHSISYQIGNSSPSSGSGVTSEPFIINTSGFLFQLSARPNSHNDSRCDHASGEHFSDLGHFELAVLRNVRRFCPCFPRPLAGSTFTVFSSGVMTYSGTITTVSCSPMSHSLPFPVPAGPHARRRVPWSGTILSRVRAPAPSSKLPVRSLLSRFAPPGLSLNGSVEQLPPAKRRALTAKTITGCPDIASASSSVRSRFSIGPSRDQKLNVSRKNFNRCSTGVRLSASRKYFTGRGPGIGRRMVGVLPLRMRLLCDREGGLRIHACDAKDG